MHSSLQQAQRGCPWAKMTIWLSSVSETTFSVFDKPWSEKNYVREKKRDEPCFPKERAEFASSSLPTCCEQNRSAKRFWVDQVFRAWSLRRLWPFHSCQWHKPKLQSTQRIGTTLLQRTRKPWAHALNWAGKRSNERCRYHLNSQFALDGRQLRLIERRELQY